MSQDRDHKIANVLETYFSDASLLWDKVMLSKILADPNGMVSFETLCKLPKFKALHTTPEEIKSSAEKYSQSKLQIVEEKIGRIKPYVVNKKEELDKWSIYVEGLEKPYNNEQKITELFSSLIGHVSFFRIPPNQHNQVDFLSYCFIEFDHQDNVEKAVRLLNRYNGAKSDLKIADQLQLRVMSKLDWNRYKDEYLQVIEDRKAQLKKLWDDFYQEYPDGHYEQVYHEPEITKEKAYEEGIVVFVNGLHLQSTRTSATNILQHSGIEIAFMHNKKKGLSSVYIRLKNPEDAKKICRYFEEHPTIQETGKDTVGKEQDTKTMDCLKLRVLGGAEESIYWESEMSGKL